MYIHSLINSIIFWLNKSELMKTGRDIFLFHSSLCETLLYKTRCIVTSGTIFFVVIAEYKERVTVQLLICKRGS